MFSDGELLSSISKTVYRCIESSKKIASMAVVDTLEEQFLLEEMVDSTKPPAEPPNGYDYLIRTPFRYPPLRHGSRFGTISDPSFFYASGSINTCFSECAYYRHLFITDNDAELGNQVISYHVVFTVKLHASNMVDLTASCYDEFQHKLKDSKDYSFTQRVGEYVDEFLGAGVIKFNSARADGVNYAVSDINCIKSKKPIKREQFTCISSAKEILIDYEGILNRVDFIS